jgi:LacI family transcriptional regulator
MPKQMRATVADVAREAGLSVATVDRVLNRRAPVKVETARRVHEAAVKVSFHASGLLGRRLESMKPPRRLGFVLLRRSERFYRVLAAELVRTAREFEEGKHEPIVEHLDDLTPASIADHLARWGGRCDALAIVAPDHPKINAAIERLDADGIPVFTMLSDVTTPARAGFFGIDHRKAGRTAGWAISRLAQSAGELGIVLGNHRYLGQELSESSFRSFIREHAPEFRLLEPLAAFENARFAYEAMLDLLQRCPALVGLYVAGGGVTGPAIIDKSNVDKVRHRLMDAGLN